MLPRVEIDTLLTTATDAADLAAQAKAADGYKVTAAKAVHQREMVPALRRRQ
jgi:hypothetical protein